MCVIKKLAVRMVADYFIKLGERVIVIAGFIQLDRCFIDRFIFSGHRVFTGCGSVILCGALMLEHLGQHDAANRIREAVGKAITGKSVTEDLAAQVTGSRVVGCKEFGDIIGAYL